MKVSCVQFSLCMHAGEIIENEKFTVIGFVPADVICLKKSVWFRKLDSDQVKQVDEFVNN